VCCSLIAEGKATSIVAASIYYFYHFANQTSLIDPGHLSDVLPVYYAVKSRGRSKAVIKAFTGTMSTIKSIARGHVHFSRAL
jgi:hypothetical protein